MSDKKKAKKGSQPQKYKLIVEKDVAIPMRDGAIICNTGHYDCELNLGDLEARSASKRTAYTSAAASSNKATIAGGVRLKWVKKMTRGAARITSGHRRSMRSRLSCLAA